MYYRQKLECNDAKTDLSAPFDRSSRRHSVLFSGKATLFPSDAFAPHYHREYSEGFPGSRCVFHAVHLLRARCVACFARCSLLLPVQPILIMTQPAGPDIPPPDAASAARPKRRRPHLPPSMARFVAISWHDLAVSFGPILLVSAAALYLAVRLIQPAPPSTLTMSAGPKGSSFYINAEKYKDILARNGVPLKVQESQGSLDNLLKLEDPKSGVDVGFVQGGMTVPGVANDTHKDLMSLGSVGSVPLAIFYRGPVLTRLSEFQGKRLAIGGEGSGTRALALALLKANGITPGDGTELQSLSGDEAAAALTNGDIDAAFLTGDSAQPPTMAKLLRQPGIRFFDFSQAEAYSRRFPYLKVIELPMGAFDFAKN